jgi:hypothetical protein
MVKKREEDNQNLRKIVKIQALMRGSKVRKNLKNSLIKKFESVQNFFDNMRSIIENESATIIQRNWKKAIIKIKRLQTFKHVLGQLKMVRIMERWAKLGKNSKQERRKSKHIGYRNLVHKEEKLKPNASNHQMSKSKFP